MNIVKKEINSPTISKSRYNNLDDFIEKVAISRSVDKALFFIYSIIADIMSEVYND